MVALTQIAVDSGLEPVPAQAEIGDGAEDAAAQVLIGQFGAWPNPIAARLALSGVGDPRR